MGESAISVTSLIDEFKLLCSLAWRRVGLASLRAAVDDVDALGRLLSTLRLWSWETAVTCSDSAEAPLTPLQLTRSALFDALDCVECMLTSRGAVSLDLTWHFDHTMSLLACEREPATDGPYMRLSWLRRSRIDALRSDITVNLEEPEGPGMGRDDYRRVGVWNS